nr:LysR substrate-binding domain-containing protein [Paraburkholderia sp. HD33-4]
MVPLVSIAPPCPFLHAAQRVLDAAGRPWRVALTTPSLDGLRAAAEAGLGIACRTEAGLRLPALCDTAPPRLPEIAYFTIERRHNGAESGFAARSLTSHLALLATASATCA